MTLTVASLCSGYGGLEMALRLWLGEIETVWHAEINADAARVLKTHEPEVPNLGDFTLPDFWDTAPRASLHAGGVPCQPFSSAGRQLGEADDRYLWPFWLEGIRRTLPATVVFENVQRLIQGRMRPVFDQIVADLVELGYDVRWCLLGACAVGACHHRHRVFLLACRTRTTAHARRVQVVTCDATVTALLPSPRAIDSTRGPVSPNRPQRPEKNGAELASVLNLLPTPQAVDRERTSATMIRGNPTLNGAVIGERFGKYAAAVARHAEIMGVSPPEPTEVGPRGGRRLAAAFSEWMMMLPAGHVTDILDRGPALERCGNGVVPLQAATALRLLFDDLVS
jgi:DNA (cytosine-5)-methyltransferase 1